MVKGHSLDGTHLGGHGSGGDMPLEGPFHISAKLDRLMLRDNVAVSPLSLEMAGIGDRPATMTMSGSLSKSATIVGEIAPAEQGRRLTLNTTDAGLLVKGLFGFSSIKSGRLDLSATLPGKAGDPSSENPSVPDYQGKITLRDFKVLNQPFLTRLFTAGSLGGLTNLMQGQGIGVDKLDVPFSSKGGVVAIHDARATGPAIGLTAGGYIDRAKNAVALKGTMVPVFGLNSVLGSIPVLGNVLVSKPGEGVFGMTYSVKGNADQPDLNINPLSVLTPGILRRIFEGKMPNAAQAPSNQVSVPPSTAPVPVSQQ
ncbi:MAG: AsmA-like C-terminal domain-containing protein [Rhizomicrobium sp.]